jgi:hypothetical protein
MTTKSVAFLLTMLLCVGALSLVPSCGGKGEVPPSEEQPAEQTAGPAAEKREGEAREVGSQDMKRWKELGAELVDNLEMLKATLAAKERELAAMEAGLRSREAELTMREAEVTRKLGAAARLQAVSYAVLALGVILIVAALVRAVREKRRVRGTGTRPSEDKKGASKGIAAGRSEAQRDGE